MALRGIIHSESQLREIANAAVPRFNAPPGCWSYSVGGYVPASTPSYWFASVGVVVELRYSCRETVATRRLLAPALLAA